VTNKDTTGGQPAFLAGGGEMGRLIRSTDWSATPLGSAESWPQSLRTTVSLCLPSNFPMCIAWGPKHVMIYNDGYWPICGAKHPHSMGQNFSECWASAWPVIGEPFARALAGHASFIENQRMFLDRNGYLEETFFTFSFSPIRDETGGVGGVLNPCHETTAKMLSERRTRALRDLAARTGKAKSVEEVLALSAQTMTEYELDVPFALLYAPDARGQGARLVASTGLETGTDACPDADLEVSAQSAWPVAPVFRSGSPAQVDDIGPRLGPPPYGPYPEPPKTALLLPITPPGSARPAVVLVAGVSPRLPLNEAYRDFYDLLAAGVTTAIANARAYDEERKRAEALAELDRAKTEFFSNVSHEFRTPLTLILGPLEQMLGDDDAELAPDSRARLAVVHRNALRLLKLVNALLDFSRIEAGRVQASYQPTDLPAFTAELASVFRAAAEGEGLRLDVDCPPMADVVWVDRDMWEKIVLNLVSNAFKFTFEGGITVRTHDTGDHVDMTVTDTGVGIPEADLPRVFERFHRVRGARARTHEGTGIGLALVQELVRLHGGSVTVASEVGRGTTFTVSVPRGAARPPSDRASAAPPASSTRVRGQAYAEEALRWLDHDQQEAADAEPASPLATRRARVLLADDNADMRDYVRRLLAERYEVEAVSTARAGLEAIRDRRPDLVVTDIMMPGLDGLGFLRALRQDPRTRSIPVILLSARAGDEARVDGLAAGAVDYLVKPFSARELIARVAAHLETARRHYRAEAELLRQLVTVEEDERRRISRALHDDTGQNLAALSLGLKGLEAHVAHGARERLQQMQELVNGVARQVHDGAFDLRPRALDDLGLVPTLRQHGEDWGRRHGVQVDFHARGLADGRLPAVAEATIYRAVVESLTNVARHAAARRVSVILERTAGEVCAIVEDDGVGFDVQAAQRGGTTGGLGLHSLRERVELAGGTADVESSRGCGTTVFVRIPLMDADARS
jgi:signal transduction histidine kinase